MTCNPSKVNVRAGIDECWKGTTAMLAQRAVIYTHLKRNANILEWLLATGTGTIDNPANMRFEGSPGYWEMMKIWPELSD